MPAFRHVRRLALGTAFVFLLVLAAACGGGTWPTGARTSPSATAEASPTPSPTPTPTPTPTPMSTLDSFRARIAARDFQAQGQVDGSITVKTILGSRSGPVTGIFKVKGPDSAYWISSKVMGITGTVEYVVVGDWAYSRTSGGSWTRTSAPGKTLASLVNSGILVTDQGVETKFGRQLHHLRVASTSGVDLTAFGVWTGPDQENLVVELSFWAETDGTPAGLSIGASFDQKILGTPSHETATLDIGIDTSSGVTITAPTN